MARDSLDSEHQCIIANSDAADALTQGLIKLSSTHQISALSTPRDPALSDERWTSVHNVFVFLDLLSTYCD